MSFVYPQPKREDVYEDYHGTKIFDPYRWMEATDDPKDLTDWIQEENKLTEEYVSKCKSRDQILKNLTEVFNYEKVGTPFKVGNNKYYFYKNDGLQNQYVLYERENLTAEPKVLLDPNTLSEDGTISLGSINFSFEGKYLAYCLSKSGSDWTTIHIKLVDSREDLKEELKYCKFTSIAWKSDSSGFFYTRYPAPSKNDLGTETDSTENCKIYFHQIGTSQEEDVLIFAEPDHPKRRFGVQTTKDGKYLLISVHSTTGDKNRLYYLRVDKEMEKDKNGFANVNRLIDYYTYAYDYVANDDSVFYFITNENADNKKLIQIDFEHPEKENWKEIIAESKDDPLEDVSAINQKYFVLQYTHNVVDVLKIYDFNGKYLKDLPVPGLGQILSVTGRREDKELFYKFSSFTSPGAIFRYDFDEEKTTSFYEIQLKTDAFKLDDFETKQVWYKSKDGTNIPMFILHKKGIDLNGKNPTLLYGYGGFNISLKPYCSVLRLSFIHHFDGIFAMPNLRGGNEFGEKWHQMGIKEKKQNVFDDFICAAEYLIDQKYTCTEKLVIEGGSNGGLLTAACCNQRPDLFGAVIAHVGVLDMLKFHKFTIGSAWVSDYGSSDKKEDFDYLIKYSPLHNIRENIDYPSVLITTSDHDDRVVPLHSFKYAAELQHTVSKNKNQKNPIIIRIETKAGHGGGKPTTKILEEYADIYSFISNSLNLNWK